jgi:hypothetical protein
MAGTVQPGYPVEVVAGQLDRGDLAAAESGELVDRCELVQFGHASSLWPLCDNDPFVAVGGVR